MKITSLLVMISVAAIIAVGLFARQQSGKPNNSSQAANSNPSVLSKLEEIVAIRERLAAKEAILISSGRVSLDSSAGIDLIEARIELAREKDQKEAVIAELRNLVAALERRFKRFEPIAKDRLAPGEIDEFKIGLLKAEVRLLREMD